MAEPMTSNEIEDVLSSIRRLVAQDLKPADRAKLAAVADATNKLVLAPEQRVEDTVGKFVTVRRPSRRAAFPPVDAVLAGVAAFAGKGGGQGAADAGAGNWALGEAASQRANDAAALAGAQDSDQASLYAGAQDSDQGSEAAEFAHEDYVYYGNQDAASGHTDPADDMAPDLAVDLASGPAPLPAAAIELPPSYEEDAVDLRIDPSARLFDMAPNAFSNAKMESDPAPAWAAEEPDDVADLDADYGGRADFLSDDSASPQSLQGTIEPDAAWADAAEARVIAELAGEAVEEEVFHQAQESFREPNFSASAPQSAPEVLFDEEVLRAMVQAIFREEMAGPMGERITRNIRKLVRAEVGRMLAAHELE